MGQRLVLMVSTGIFLGWEEERSKQSLISSCIALVIQNIKAGFRKASSTRITFSRTSRKVYARAAMSPRSERLVAMSSLILSISQNAWYIVERLAGLLSRIQMASPGSRKLHPSMILSLLLAKPSVLMVFTAQQNLLLLLISSFPSAMFRLIIHISRQR